MRSEIAYVATALAFVSAVYAAPVVDGEITHTSNAQLSRRAKVATEVTFTQDSSSPEHGYNPETEDVVRPLVKTLLTEAAPSLGASQGVTVKYKNGFPFKNFNDGHSFEFTITGPSGCKPHCAGHMEKSGGKTSATITKPGQLKPLYEAKQL
ncbi:hypothetical protein GYMLUDRAFT_85554 [Collybiopsis luxurians FD-317 M1]|uniref:Uncharacterized protein n=1 Tax=Collybiopsis luxurians FD-317 M1 TaxID=944289 RepID=A0A0D0CVI6_9AGAR|nr:hypothetical protein GYMLUDRAFT_85554 [Collybiopsis luxurians FD-317 M1]